ncbi:phosphodiester glycosidase family protein, partial [uncultured Bacteroides sp.]
HVLGGKDALNLDGGGSTALWLSGAPEEGIVNFPCDNRNYDHQGERKVANFLYVHD